MSTEYSKIREMETTSSTSMLFQVQNKKRGKQGIASELKRIA